MSKNEFPKELEDKLEGFHVEVPDIVMKKSKLERIANWIYTPAKDPLDALGVKVNSIAKITIYPVVWVLLLFFIPIIFV